MATHARSKIRIAWVETDAPLPVAQESTPAVVVDATTPSSDGRAWSVAFWLTICGGLLFLEVWFLPAYLKMCREVGVSLPGITEAVLGTPRWIYGVGVLSLVHASAVARDPTTRDTLEGAAFLAMVFGLILTVWALFLPLCETFQKL